MQADNSNLPKTDTGSTIFLNRHCAAELKHL